MPCRIQRTLTDLHPSRHCLEIIQDSNLRMKLHFITLALMAMVLGAQAGAVDLTTKNFDTEVLESGKSAFVKFLAPWYV